MRGELGASRFENSLGMEAASPPKTNGIFFFFFRNRPYVVRRFLNFFSASDGLISNF